MKVATLLSVMAAATGVVANAIPDMFVHDLADTNPAVELKRGLLHLDELDEAGIAALEALHARDLEEEAEEDQVGEAGTDVSDNPLMVLRRDVVCGPGRKHCSVSGGYCCKKKYNACCVGQKWCINRNFAKCCNWKDL
jgi:hypothetical protein